MKRKNKYTKRFKRKKQKETKTEKNRKHKQKDLSKIKNKHFLKKIGAIF